MTRHELLIHLVGIILQMAVAVERVAETQTDKNRALFLQAKLDEWLGAIVPPRT